MKVDGTETEVMPKDGKKFDLSELREMVGGTIDIQVEPTRGRGAKRAMVVNDNGVLIGLEINEAASKIWREWYPLAEYPHNNYGTIVGNVLLCGWNQIR